MSLTDEEVARYEQAGYLVIEDVIDAGHVERLRARLREYTHEGRDVGDAIRLQTEPRVQRGELEVADRGDAIRKVAGLVEGDDLFGALARHPGIVGVVEPILGPDLKLFRNAVLMKPPQVGSQKGAHQDSPYWPIEPMALCSLWMPLDDATPQNGCMQVIPGAHSGGPLPHKKVTDDYVIAADHYDAAKLEPLPMGAGSGLFFHSLLPHYTAPNTSDRWRRAVVLSYMSARSRYTGEGDGPQYVHIQGRTFAGCVR